MNTKTTDITQALHGLYSQEISFLTPEADALFTTNGTYSGLEKTTLAHQAHFERVGSRTYKAMQIAQNETAHIGISTVVGGLWGLVEGLVRRDIINSVKRGLTYGAVLGVTSRGLKAAVYSARSMAPEVHQKEIEYIFGPDNSFVADQYAFLKAFDGIKVDAAKDPVNLARLYTIFGIEGRHFHNPTKRFGSLDEKETIQLTGASYALMALVINNIMRNDYLDLQHAAGMGAVTSISKELVKTSTQERARNHARDAVNLSVEGLDDHERKQVIGGLITKWYGAPQKPSGTPKTRRSY